MLMVVEKQIKLKEKIKLVLMLLIYFRNTQNAEKIIVLHCIHSLCIVQQYNYFFCVYSSINKYLCIYIYV